MKNMGVKPELEIFDFGMIVTCLRKRSEGKLAEPLHFQFVLGTPCGAPATPESLLHSHQYIPQNSTWSVIGIGKGHLPMSMTALIMEGHIRVGMEQYLLFQKRFGQNQRSVRGTYRSDCRGVWAGSCDA